MRKILVFILLGDRWYSTNIKIKFIRLSKRAGSYFIAFVMCRRCLCFFLSYVLLRAYVIFIKHFVCSFIMRIGHSVHSHQVNTSPIRKVIIISLSSLQLCFYLFVVIVQPKKKRSPTFFTLFVVSSDLLFLLSSLSFLSSSPFLFFRSIVLRISNHFGVLRVIWLRLLLPFFKLFKWDAGL